MPGLVPGIHVLKRLVTKVVDGRDKRGHDEAGRYGASSTTLPLVRPCAR